MRNGVVVAIHPFLKNQKIEIYKDNEKIETVNCPMKDLEKTIYSLCKDYDLYEVHTFGSFSYGERIKEKLGQELRFGLNAINVIIH